jgi:protocatechuate 3,4-dioxygenase beta subunit
VALTACVAWAAIPTVPAQPALAQILSNPDTPTQADRTSPESRNARVHGTVVDEAGKPVPGIEVRASTAGDRKSRGRTDAQGHFDFLIRKP